MAAFRVVKHLDVLERIDPQRDRLCVPRTPTLLCGSDNDTTVLLKNAKTAIKAHGSNQVSMLDLGSGDWKDNSALEHLVTEDECAIALRQGFFDKFR